MSKQFYIPEEVFLPLCKYTEIRMQRELSHTSNSISDLISLLDVRDEAKASENE